MILNGGRAADFDKREFYTAFALLAALFAFMLFSDPAWAQTPPPQTALTVTKNDSLDPVQVGDTITYTVDVRNTGNTDPAQSVVLEDPLPTNTTFVSASVTTGTGTCTEPPPGASTGTITCNLGTIDPNTTETVTIQVRPTAAAGEAGFVSNTATADGTNTNPATDTEFTTVNESDITITKDDNPDPADVGEALLYTLRITNTGDNAQTIIVEDELPDEVDFLAVDPEADCEETNNLVTCQFTIDNGDTQRVRILVQPQEDGTITNRAQVFAEDDRFTPIAEARERTVVEDNGGGGDDPPPLPPLPPLPPPPFDPEDPFEDIDDDGIIDAIDEDIDDLAEAEADLEVLDDEITDGEGTTGDDFDDDGSGVSATADGDGAEASTPGASASAGGDPDEQAPVSDPQGDVVDDVVTSGPLPNTGGVPVAAGTVLALVLFGGGLLAVRLVMIWRGRRA